MTEQNRFQPIASKPLYNDNIGSVVLYDASHANESEEQRIWTVSTLAGIAYGNEEAKNPEALYARLKSLKHESLWEFIRDGVQGGTAISGSMRCESEVYNYTKSHNDTNVKRHKQNIACFRIKAPIFVARQFFRHRAFSYIEMSRRYTKDSKKAFEFWFPKDFNGNKEMFEAQWNQEYDALSKEYHTQIASRFMPQTTYTEWYIMGEIEGLKNFFRLRLDSHAQEEIRELASTMLELLKEHQPTLAEQVEPQEGADNEE